MSRTCLLKEDRRYPHVRCYNPSERRRICKCSIDGCNGHPAGGNGTGTPDDRPEAPDFNATTTISSGARMTRTSDGTDPEFVTTSEGSTPAQSLSVAASYSSLQMRFTAFIAAVVIIVQAVMRF